jgi:hypothetical protein
MKAAGQNPCQPAIPEWIAYFREVNTVNSTPPRMVRPRHRDPKDFLVCRIGNISQSNERMKVPGKIPAGRQYRSG